MGEVSCKLPANPTLHDLVTLPTDCVIEEGTTFAVREQIVDAHGHVLDGDHDPLGHGGCQHDEEGRPMKKPKVPEPDPTQEPLPVQPTPVAVTMPPVVGATTATVGVADNAISEVKTLMPAGGDASMVTVALAAIGVAGGGAAWKFYQSHSKNKHDEAMKRLEIEEQRTQKQDDQHQACNASRVALEAKVATLTAKVDELASKPAPTGSSFDLSEFDPEELEARLKKLEESLKAKGKRR